MYKRHLLTVIKNLMTELSEVIKESLLESLLQSLAYKVKTFPFIDQSGELQEENSAPYDEDKFPTMSLNEVLDELKSHIEIADLNTLEKIETEVAGIVESTEISGKEILITFYKLSMAIGERKGFLRSERNTKESSELSDREKYIRESIYRGFKEVVTLP